MRYCQRPCPSKLLLLSRVKVNVARSHYDRSILGPKFELPASTDCSLFSFLQAFHKGNCFWRIQLFWVWSYRLNSLHCQRPLGVSHALQGRLWLQTNWIRFSHHSSRFLWPWPFLWMLGISNSEWRPRSVSQWFAWCGHPHLCRISDSCPASHPRASLATLWSILGQFFAARLSIPSPIFHSNQV